MNIKKVLAGSLAAITAGATILISGIAAANTLGNYVVTSDGSLTSPVIAVGGTAAVDDVLSAVDIGVATAGYATTATEIAGTSTVSVTNGAKIDTASTKLYTGDAFTKTGTKTTVTKTDLPTLLASGTFADDNGIAYKYDQYISWGAGTVSFGNSGGDLDDPVLYIDTGSSTAAPFFNYFVTFNKPLNISSTNVIGNVIDLLGTKYTIGSGSSFDGTTNKLILFGSSNAQLLSEGEEKTVVVNTVEHTVKLLGVSSSTVAVVSVDGESKEVTQGGSYAISGVEVYVDSVFYYPKEAQVSQAKLSFGSQKLILENGQAVKTGTSEDTVEGTLVALTGVANTGISKVTVAMTAKDQSTDYIKEGGTFTDPAFGIIKVAFYGLNKGTTDKITIDNSGTTAATIKFNDYRGNEKSIIYAITSSSSFAPGLNWTSTKSFHVLEKQTVRKFDYVMLAPTQESEFSHVMQYSAASNLGTSGAYIELQDVFTGDTTRVYLLPADYGNATFYLDGQAYYVNVTDNTVQTAVFTWGTNAAANTVGDTTMVYPLIKAKGGEWVAFTHNVTLVNTTTYEFPTANSTNGSFQYYAAGMAGSYITLGRVNYAIDASHSATVATAAGVGIAHPAILVVEEKGKNTADSEVQDAVIAYMADGSGTNVDLTIQTPILTAATSYNAAETTDNSVTWYQDRYGTLVKYDSDGQGLVEITYPDQQAEAIVAVGSNPTFTAAGGGTTVETAVKITEPVAKLDSEIDTAAITYDLVLVGGPCVNTLVATLLKDTVTCDTWAYSEGIIKEVTGIFGTSHKALIVAGTTKADTRALAAKVMKGTLSYEA
jgi:hypothetical protein